MKGKTDHADPSATCLIVDDEAAILRLVSTVLEDMGCETLLAPNAEAALEILADVSPDLMITDVRLPGMDGIELARVVKSSAGHSSMPVILMSAFGEPQNHVGDDFITKPFDIEMVTDFVGLYLHQEN